MLERFTAWLNETRLHEYFVNHESFVPAIQSVHILGVAAVVTMISMLSVRLLKGPAATPTVSEMALRFMPLTWIAVSVLLVTGMLLVITEPERELYSNPFWIKMTLIAVLLALTVLLHFAARRDANFWYASPLRRQLAAVIGVTSLLLCASIVAAGRLIAYIVNA